MSGNVLQAKVVKTLFSHKWMEVKELETDKGSYIYHHSNWCNGEGVAVLAYRKVLKSKAKLLSHFEEEKYEIQVLGRYEICPAHDLKFELCSITGGMDKEGETALATAQRELLEEAGYDVDANKFIYLGESHPSKQSDTVIHMYAVVITDEEQQEIAGDGTMGEEGAYCKWKSIEEMVDNSKDPLVHSMILKCVVKLW